MPVTSQEPIEKAERELAEVKGLVAEQFGLVMHRFCRALADLNKKKLVRALQCLGRNCDAAVFAPGSTTTVVPIVTRL